MFRLVFFCYFLGTLLKVCNDSRTLNMSTLTLENFHPNNSHHLNIYIFLNKKMVQITIKLWINILLISLLTVLLPVKINIKISDDVSIHNFYNNLESIARTLFFCVRDGPPPVPQIFVWGAGPHRSTTPILQTQANWFSGIAG